MVYQYSKLVMITVVRPLSSFSGLQHHWQLRPPSAPTRRTPTCHQRQGTMNSSKLLTNTRSIVPSLSLFESRYRCFHHHLFSSDFDVFFIAFLFFFFPTLFHSRTLQTQRSIIWALYMYMLRIEMSEVMGKERYLDANKILYVTWHSNMIRF